MASKKKKKSAPVAKSKKAANKPAKKAAPKKKVAAKKAVPKKAAPKKKVVVKKATPKKASPKKVTTKNILQLKPVKLQAPKNVDYSKAITPLADRLVVRVVDGTERVTSGGIIIPSSVSQATGFLKAEVLAVGNGAANKKGHVRPLDVKKGDTVLFAEHAGTKVQFNSEDLQIIHETDVMGIVQ